MERVERPSLSHRKGEVARRDVRPFLRVADLGIEEMGDGKAGAERRAIAAVEGGETWRNRIVQPPADALDEIFADGALAKLRAFDGQRFDLVQRVDGPQARVELEPVDDGERLAEEDVLRTEVAVAVDDPPPCRPFEQSRRAFGEKTALSTIDAIELREAEAQCRIDEDAPILRKSRAPASEENFGRRQDRGGVAVEFAEHVREAIERGPVDRPFREGRDRACGLRQGGA